METNEEMARTVMHLCRAEDYGKLHCLLIGRVAWKDGIDEGHSLLHDIADILKMAKDDAPEWSESLWEDWFEKWFLQFHVKDSEFTTNSEEEK